MSFAENGAIQILRAYPQKEGRHVAKFPEIWVATASIILALYPKEIVKKVTDNPRWNRLPSAREIRDACEAAMVQQMD